MTEHTPNLYGAEEDFNRDIRNIFACMLFACLLIVGAYVFHLGGFS